MKRYSAKAVANYFLELATRDDVQLTQMKLQKLVYYAHGWHLGLGHGPLLDEVIQAWSFGPVVRSLYNEFRDFGSDAITRMATRVTVVPGKNFALHETTPKVDDAIKPFLEKIWEVYGGISAIPLSRMTHAEGTPWHRVWQKFGGQIPKYATIPDEWIEEHFKSKATAT